MRSRVVSGIVLFAALGVPRAWAAVNGTEIGAPERAVAAVEASLEQLRADVAVARERSDTAPPSFTPRLDELRADLGRAIERLQGQPWATVEPLLRREARLRRNIDALRRELDDWPTAAGRRLTRHAERAIAGTGGITGRVTDEGTGAPIEGVYVVAYDSSGSFAESAITDAAGVYVTEGLGSGVHFVKADDYDYLDELYDNLPCESFCTVTEGTPVPVVDGQTTAGIHFALLPLSRISGTVLDSGGRPLAGVEVVVYDASGSWAGYANSDAAGAWTVQRLEGGIYFAVARSSFYLDELYDGLPCEPSCTPGSGTQILVPASAHVTGIDFGLDPGGSISGRITDDVSGEPLQYARVLVYDATGAQMTAVSADEQGRYHAVDLPTGTYFARTDMVSGHADELFDDLPCEPTCSPAQGTPIAVMAGQERPGVDFALMPLGSIAGTVTDANAGTPVPGIAVRIVDAQGNYVESTNTNASGRYASSGLTTGTYFVFTYNWTWVDELYDNRPCEPSCAPTSGTPVPVTLGNQTSGIDFALDFGGWVTGTVRTQAGGTPIPGADVFVFTATGTQVDWVDADSTGRYVLGGLTAGTYFAYAQTADHVRELYRELPCGTGCSPLTGTPIAVALSQPTGGIDFTLVRLGRIEGRVTDAATGFPIVNVDVQAYNASGQQVAGDWSATGGWYTLDRIPAGTYYVRTGAWSQLNLVDELYDNITCEPTCTVTTGTPVVVALDATTGGIDFALRRPVFADVPVTHFAWRAVEAVYAAGITSGCASAPLRFCPDASVNRAQMAVFLLTAKEGAGYQPPPAQGIFGDVPVGDPFARWIEELFNRGIASGCSANPPLYCPAAPTTRAQMAPLLLLTREGAGYQPPGAVGVFEDVPAADPFARWIEELVRRRVTSGCSVSPPLYCPGQATTRGQMAVFLASTFAVPLP